MKIYIAGPMTGYPEFNFPAFFDAEQKLIESSWPARAIINPARIDQENGLDVTGLTGDPDEIEDCFCIREAMQRNCTEICNCVNILMLKGWENSKGARAEHALAICLGLKIYYQG